MPSGAQPALRPAVPVANDPIYTIGRLKSEFALGSHLGPLSRTLAYWVLGVPLQEVTTRGEESKVRTQIRTDFIIECGHSNNQN